MKTLKILSERVMKVGYVIRHEVCSTPTSDAGQFERVAAYTPRGEYIGTTKIAHYLCMKRGIRPELRTPDSCVCSIGFSPKDGKWYGWSHRAIFGFKIGSKCKRGDCHYNVSTGPWTAKTVADARRMACQFAESVS